MTQVPAPPQVFKCEMSSETGKCQTLAEQVSEQAA